MTRTLNDKVEAHPIIEFLRLCGVHNFTQFPAPSFLIESNERLFQNTTAYVPLRLPNQAGVVYESFFRIAKTFELPATDGSKHRKFYELEWRFDPNPLLEEENHAAFSFISGDVECPHCRAVFIPEATIVSEKAVKITCPSCLHYWTIHVDSDAVNQPKIKLLSDSFYRDPTGLNRQMATWGLGYNTSESQEEFERFFPTEFEVREEGSSLDWFFGEQRAYVQTGHSTQGDFELFVKSFLNSLCLQYFQGPADLKPASNLDETEVFRKSAIQARDEEPVSFTEPTLAEAPADRIELQLERMDSLPSDGEGSQPNLHKIFTTQTYVADLAPRSAVYPKEGLRRLLPLAISASIVTMLMGAGIAYVIFSGAGSTEPVASSVAVKPVEIEEPSADLKKPDSVVKETLSEKKPVEIVAAPTEVAPAETTTAAPKETVAAAPIENSAAKPTEEAALEETPAETKESNDEKVVQISKQIPVSSPEVKAPQPDPSPVEADKERQLAKLAMIDAGYRQGMLHLKLQQAKEAASEFERVLELDPKHSESYRNLGLAYVYDRRFNEAIGVFEKYLSFAKKSADRASVQELLSTLKERLKINQD